MGPDTSRHRKESASVKITIKLFAVLREKMPPGSKGEEAQLEVDEGTRPVDVIERLEIPKQLAHLVMIDGVHLLPDEIEKRVLKPGEVLAIFPPIAGGR